MICQLSRTGLLDQRSPGIWAAAHCPLPWYWEMRGTLFMNAPNLTTFASFSHYPYIKMLMVPCSVIHGMRTRRSGNAWHAFSTCLMTPLKLRPYEPKLAEWTAGGATSLQRIGAPFRAGGFGKTATAWPNDNSGITCSTGTTFHNCFRTLQALCVCFCGTKTKRLSAIASQPFCRWPRHEYRSG